MGCKNSTAKSADNKKKASQNTKATPAAKEQKPAEQPKHGVQVANAKHTNANPALAAVNIIPPAPAEPEAVMDEEAKEAATEDKNAVVEPVADPAEALAAAAAAASAVVAAPVPRVATAPADEEEEEVRVKHNGRRRRSTAASIHQESQTQRVKDPNSPYVGPGPVETFPIDNIYRCFDQENGLLFRLVNKKRHLWAFYNDTTEYVMRVSVTFGPESAVTALGDTKATVVNAETGECILTLEVRPGETKQFMRGEYNGFTTCYDADPIDVFGEEEEE